MGLRRVRRALALFHTAAAAGRVTISLEGRPDQCQLPGRGAAWPSSSRQGGVEKTRDGQGGGRAGGGCDVPREQKSRTVVSDAQGPDLCL